MKVASAVTSPRVEQNSYNISKLIKQYGVNNNYPQKILEIINSSGTGKVCFDIYVKFIRGIGFIDQVLNELQINDKKERANTLLGKCAKDLRAFNGFAVLVKYNGLFEAVEFYNVPFEHCRIEIDSNKKYTGKICVHPDWTNLKGIQFNEKDVKRIHRFNPTSVQVEMTEAGGPENYLGQIYYFTSDGDFEYPICPFDAIVTDMLTEESVSTVKHRNAKHNFLPSGILVRKGIKPQLDANGNVDPNNERNREQEASAEEIKRMQGDENTSKIWVVDVDSDEEMPQFIPFDAKNYDKQYEYTEGTVQDNIARMSMIPPILRGIDIGAGFGATLMKEAYSYMNSITGDERKSIELVFTDLFSNYSGQFTSFEIGTLEYVSDIQDINPALLPDLTQTERRGLAGFTEPVVESQTILAQVIGVGGTQALTTIVSDPILLPEQKVQLLIQLFNFSEENARKIIEV